MRTIPHPHRAPDNGRQGEAQTVLILLAGMPTMLATIMRSAALGVREAVVEDWDPSEGSLVEVLRSHAPDIVILADERPGADQRYPRLLEEFPRTRIVVIDADGRRGHLHEMRACSVRIDELSIEALTALLRERPSRALH